MTLRTIIAATMLATSFASFSTSAAFSAGMTKHAAAGTLTTGQKRKIFGKPDGTYGGKNTATAFTNFCYAQFGPKAKWPDADLLQKCLSK